MLRVRQRNDQAHGLISNANATRSTGVPPVLISLKHEEAFAPPKTKPLTPQLDRNPRSPANTCGASFLPDLPPCINTSVTFPYDLTYDEYLESLRALSRVADRNWSRTPMIVGLTGFALFFTRPADDLPAATASLILMAISAFTSLYPVHWSNTQSRKTWKSHYDGPRYSGSLTIADDSITWTTASSRSEFQWAAFKRSRETRHLILLERGPREFFAIAKRSFPTQDDLHAFRSLLSHKALTPSIGFPVIRREQ